MHLANGRREPRIGQPAQEPRRRIVTRRRPQRLDEKDLHQPGQHQLATRSLLVRLVADQPHQHRQSLDAAHVAEAVWRAASDSTGQLRFPAGPDAVALAKSA